MNYASWNTIFITPPPLPVFQPLSKISTRIKATDAVVVYTRLTQCFTQRDIEAEYKCDDSEISAVLTKRVNAEQMCCMTIHLYSAGEGMTSGSDIVVELNRLNGDTLLFHQECKFILKAARGIASDKKSGGSSCRSKRKLCSTLVQSSTIARSVTPERLSCTKEKGVTATILPVTHNFKKRCGMIDEELISSLEKVDELMKKDRVDARFIGWKTLCALTDLRSASASNALYTAQIVLGIDEEVGASMDIHDVVFSVLLKDSRNSEDDDEVEIQFAKKIRIIAINILHNALSTISLLDRWELLSLFDVLLKQELVKILANDLFAKQAELELYMTSLSLNLLNKIESEFEDSKEVPIVVPPMMSPRTRFRQTYHREHSQFLSKHDLTLTL